jgi:P pilus assembly chaperone PapD
MISTARFRTALTMLIAFALPAYPARAELVLSQLVVDLKTGSRQREDVEIWNNSNERTYVAIDPNEILNAGKPNQVRQQEADPEKRGLLVSPTRMILEPGQRKHVRIARIGAETDRERVYRVTVKPVVGELAAEDTGLKVLVGYDVLVLARPSDSRPLLNASRTNGSLIFRNDGNASLELVDGKQCEASTKRCIELPGRRLYSGAEWSQPLKSDSPVEYTIISNGKSVRRIF